MTRNDPGVGPPLSGGGGGRNRSDRGGSGRDDGLEDIKGLRRDKLADIASLEAEIRRLETKISNWELLLENMSDSNPDKRRLPTEIANANYELREKHEGLEQLKADERELGDLVRNWRRS